MYINIKYKYVSLQEKRKKKTFAYVMSNASAVAMLKVRREDESLGNTNKTKVFTIYKQTEGFICVT